jgi:hypothetical protein
LKLEYDEPPSDFAFKLIVRRYNLDAPTRAWVNAVEDWMRDCLGGVAGVKGQGASAS